jgi:hypothetical protein
MDVYDNYDGVGPQIFVGSGKSAQIFPPICGRMTATWKEFCLKLAIYGTSDGIGYVPAPLPDLHHGVCPHPK